MQHFIEKNGLQRISSPKLRNIATPQTHDLRPASKLMENIEFVLMGNLMPTPKLTHDSKPSILL